ncbi:anthrax toxin-like adenylyl cyclase domain-containing protein [Terracidiphilus sp.]|uniref:anthrax toxin-like adenylyl cyclase domain-containing protein n=1 Tax=Terracidiphilus sp. TaxID=1964191 RepID=UPI003C1F1040
MTLQDMQACCQVATRLNEVIIFRSTGPWSLRWLEKNYPTKNFHVKGKSSDWGPMAGFVPYLGKYSKVGGNAEKEKVGTAYNDDGLKHKYAQKTQLCLTLAELQIQRSTVSNGRTALTEMQQVENSPDYYLVALRSSDRAKFAFRAAYDAAGFYRISVYPKYLPLKGLAYEKPTPLEVMTSSEVGANNRPMTGDYDLMSVCPAWSNYGERSLKDITKPGLNFGRQGGVEPGAAFKAGVNLDAVLDMRLNTGLPTQMTAGPNPKAKTFGATGFTAAGYGKAPDLPNAANTPPGRGREHGDMGNISARILRCINELNAAMGQTGPFRRVHHNAESHRNVIFGGIQSRDMELGEGFPITSFQPVQLRLARYDTVTTLENMAEFRTYAGMLNAGGYYVQKNWAWGMSTRNEVI